MRHILITAILALLLAPVDLSATSVVVFRRHDLVVLASDAFRTILRDGQETHQRRCKILPVAGRFWFVSTGFSGATNTAIDTSALVTATLAPAKTLADVRDLIFRKVYPHIERVLTSLRDTPLFEMFEGTDLISFYLFGGMNEGDPTLRVAMFLIRHDNGKPLKLRASFLECPGLWCPNDEKVFFGASVDSSAGAPTVKLVTPPRASWVEKGNSEAARRIIELQIKATPASVGPPISILELTANGARWAQRGACAALQPTATIK